MRLFRANLALLLAASLAVAPAFAATSAKSTKAKSSVTKTTRVKASTAKRSATKTTASKSTTAKTTTTKKKAVKTRGARGQQAIESSRVVEIQQALIRTRYLSGEPNGKWDDTTIAAMKNLQANQGWQTRIMPDSRALKLLGLGPDYSNAINAAGASFTDPPPVSTIPTDVADGFTLASGVKQ